LKYIKSFIEKNSDTFKLFLRINRLIFLFTTLIYLLLLIINQFWSETFKEFLNINAIFILLLISGLLLILPVLREKEKVNKKSKLECADILLFLIIGTICSILIWIEIKEFGIISYIISFIGGVITFVLPILLIYN